MSVPAEDVRRLVKAHRAQTRQSDGQIEHGKAVIAGEGMAKQRGADAQRLREGDLLRRKALRVVAQGSEVRTGIVGIAAHRGEDVALVIAVQAGHALRAQKAERLAGQRAEIDLIPERNDALRTVLFDRLQDGFQPGQVAVDIGNERDAHGFLLGPANCADGVIMV